MVMAFNDLRRRLHRLKVRATVIASLTALPMASCADGSAERIRRDIPAEIGGQRRRALMIRCRIQSSCGALYSNCKTYDFGQSNFTLLGIFVQPPAAV